MLKPKNSESFWMHTYSPYKPKKFKQMLSSCQKAGGNCADGKIHATKDHNNVRIVLRNTKETT
jgi:hypothetical protein